MCAQQARGAHRRDVHVFLSAAAGTQREVAGDAQVGRSQVKGHGDAGPVLPDLHMLWVPVCRCSEKTEKLKFKEEAPPKKL